MNKGLLVGLGVLGALALLGSSSKAAVVPSPPPPPPPPPKPKPKVQISIGPATIEPSIPEGWVAAPPGTVSQDTITQIQALGGKPGTTYPFVLDSKKYLAMVLPDGSVGILQPEYQI